MGVFDKHRKDVFAIYNVELTFHERIVGGVPKDPKIIEGWIRSKAGVEKTEEVRQMLLTTLQELGAEVGPGSSYEELVAASQELAGDKHTTGFKRNGEGFYIESRQIDAMMKESAAIIFPYPKTKIGPTKKAAKSFFGDAVFTSPHRVPLGRQEPDGVDLAIIHAQGRSALSYFEYVEKPILQFQVEVVGNEITLDQWAAVWVHAERNGLGSRRSQGEGKFEVTKWEKVA